MYYGARGEVRVPVEVFEEIKDGKDSLARWINSSEVRERLLLTDEAEPGLVTAVVSAGYASDLTDDEVLKMGRDPFLIAYALTDSLNRCIVTTEVSRPSRRRGNRHIPDVCRDLGISCCNTFELTRALNFSTSWRVVGKE